ncbi:MAG: TIR domain-containing protein [Chloroflexi bacterium]|nr:TIR domain-containing protein [Chloroflexota bacterium]
MPSHNLFISHSWGYSDAYEKLINLLIKKSGFEFKDYSVPKDDPIHNAANTAQLRKAIYTQISPSGVVLVMAGVYASYSKWIDIEIDIAKEGFNKPKPIIAIRPWGNERMSKLVQDSADKIVNWNTNSIVNAIIELG